MTFTVDDLSLWELGFRLVGEDPYKWRPLGLPAKVNDAHRLIANEMLHLHLDTTLITDKWHEGLDTTPDMHIRYYLDDIQECIRGRKFDAKFLKYAAVDRWEFFHWCERSGYPKPDFWYSCQFSWPEEDDEHEGEQEDIGPIDHPDKLSPNQRTRVARQEIAKALWMENPETTIADMIKNNEIIRLTGGKMFAEKTLRRWFSQVAPVEVKEKVGRPKKQNNV